MADLLALVCDVDCDFVTFPFDIIGQVPYLIVSIPDPCCLHTFKANCLAICDDTSCCSYVCLSVSVCGYACARRRACAPPCSLTAFVPSTVGCQINHQPVHKLTM